MAVVLQLTGNERDIVARLLVNAASDAARDTARPDEHFHFLEALRLACTPAPFIALNSGRAWLAAAITRQGVQREDVLTASALLARLAAVGAMA